MDVLALPLAGIALAAAWALTWAMGGPVPPVSSDVVDRDPMPQPQHQPYRDTSSHRPASVRARSVTSRRTTSGTGEAAYQRFARRAEEAQGAMNERMEEGFDRILSELSEIKIDVRRLEQNDGQLTNRISDLEFQVIGTRDVVQKNQSVVTPGRVQSVKVAAEELLNSRWGRVVKFSVGFAAIWACLQLVPDVVDGVKSVTIASWQYIDGLNE